MGLGLVLLKPYQWERIRGFLATWSDASQAPYQVKQSLTSLGVGGTNGVGLGGGLQKLSFLPEANTDFVFAVIGEELGLVGTLGVLGLWVTLLVCGFHMIRSLKPGSSERIAATTLLSLLAVQSVINMCVVTALAPPKGISHPLVSYGGSSLVSSLIGTGIVLSLCRGSASSVPAA
jgi:cell division protein FtsW